jgi:two-component system invasion response regulator UvrY
MIRVFIADDHHIVRGGLKSIISEQVGMEVCGEAAEANGLVDLVAGSGADVVIMDVNMPGGGSPLLVRSLRALPSPPQVVIFTMYQEDSHAVGFLRSGAAAFINKQRAPEELFKAVRLAAAGRQYLTQELQAFLLQNQIEVQKHPLDLLSAREVMVVRLLAVGKRATEIAHDLGVSTSTVNTYVERVKTKLGLRTTVEVVQYASENGLLG